MNKIFIDTSAFTKSNFYIFIAVITLFRLIVINFIPLTPQEAYYWNYAQHPAFSYFDHPPLTAYSILFGTTLFGDNFFGVKFMAVMWGLAINILLYFTARLFITSEDEKKQNRTAFGVVILYNLTVFAHIYSITIVPDSTLLFFWLLGIYAIKKSTDTGKFKWWMLAGVVLGFGLLSKYTAIILAGSIFLYLLFEGKSRRYFLKPHPYFAFILALVIFSPVIYWNAAHDWASFEFQFVERAENTKSITYKYFVQLIISQLFLLSPLIFVWIMKYTSFHLKRWRESQKVRLLLFTGLPIIIFFTYTSFTSLVKMNWLLPGYLSLIILIGITQKEKLFELNILRKIGIGISLFIILLGHAVILIPNVPLGDGNTWSGWNAAAKKVYEYQKQLGGPNNTFVFGNSYKAASLLKFYLPDHQETYSNNVYGKPGLQYAFWSDTDQLVGMNAIYVHDNRKEYKNDLKYIRNYFDEIQPIETLEFKAFGKTARKISIYLARNYHGKPK